MPQHTCNRIQISRQPRFAGQRLSCSFLIHHPYIGWLEKNDTVKLETGQGEGHEAPPILNNRVMFVATPGNQVLAIDTKSGDLLWRYKRPIPDDMLLLHPTSRG